jgi:biotin carboxyl carrier protein
LRKHWLRRALPNLLIAGGLVGVGYWGHRSDWSLPKFSALVAGNASAGGEQCPPGEDAWCKEHNVPEAICIECNTKLLPAEADYGWCAEHGIAQCPLHHPEIAQLRATPVVTAEDLNRANRTLALLPRVENNSHCKHYQRRIQFASIEAIEKAGIDIAIVDQKPVIETVAANGEIVYDETHTAHLASRVPGTVWRVEKKVGDSVRKGDILALVDSAETTAEAVASALDGKELGSEPGRVGSVRFFATDSPERFARVGEIFLGQPIDPKSVDLVDLLAQ